jgi:hypothetical protein
MRRFIRLAIAAGAAVSALAFSGSAWAAYSPSLTVTSQTSAPGRPTAVVLGHVQAATDDATAKDTIYAPPGYGVNLTQAAGTRIGNVSARLILRQGGNAEVDVEGQVIADNPALYLNNPCTRSPTPHGAVWKLNITVAGTPLTVPIYVDAVTAGPEATFASAKIQLCLAGPIGTPAGAQLLFAFFDVNGVFTNPSTTTDRVWHALYTPYVAGTPTPNPAGTTEGQAVVPGRVNLSVKSKSLKRGRVTISGKLLVSGRPYRGAVIELYIGNRKVSQTRTKANGSYTFRRKIKKRTRFGVQVLELADLALPCPGPALPFAPQGCRSASISFFAAKLVTARRKR